MSWLITPRSTTWAEGGDLVYTIVVSGTIYRVHEFRTVGTTSLNVMAGGNVEYLIVAGGGGSGANGSNGAGGGGGGGGLITNTGSSLLPVTSQAYVLTVGAGGLGGPSIASRGGNGGNSSVFGLTAIGGGGGGVQGIINGLNGGSGGGAGPGGTGGSGTAGQGNSGGGNYGTGGGAGFSGADAVTPGQGLSYSITGSMVWYAGGGANPFNSTPPLGGGGRGEAGVNSGLAANGVNGTGGGGGARHGTAAVPGKNGGSGIVIVRYAIA